MGETVHTKKTFRSVERKLLRRSKLVEAIEQAKASGRAVVHTNGCFDILHLGHIRYLLVVGLNSDASVRRLKGPERPIVPEFERAEVLAALECVDYISIFSEDTPVELIRAIGPDIHVKGGDYRPEDLPESEAVRSVGGRIEVIPLSKTASEGYSTSDLVARIKSL